MYCFVQCTSQKPLFPAEKKCYQPAEKFSKMYAVTENTAGYVHVTIFVQACGVYDIHIFSVRRVVNCSKLYLSENFTKGEINV